MIASMAEVRQRPPSGQVSTAWMASFLVGASVFELAILRVGTRTAIHVPGLEQIAGPYRAFALTGRLSFYIAVVLLMALLPRLVLDLMRRGSTHSAAAIASFVVVAGLGSLGWAGTEIVAAAVTTIVASLVVVVLSHRRGRTGTVVALFGAAFIAGALHSIIDGGVGGGAPEWVDQLAPASEVLGVMAAILSGPMIRLSMGLRSFPQGLMALAGTAAAVAVTAAIVANGSTVRILMLWNLGLTGSLPAAVYGVAAGSLLIAIATSAKEGQRYLALSLVLLFLGGISMTSTYQSGLIVAGLGLLDLTSRIPEGFAAQPPTRAMDNGRPEVRRHLNPDKRRQDRPSVTTRDPRN